MKQFFSKRYERAMYKLSKKNRSIVDKATEALDRSRINPSHPSLKLHKLDGLDNYSISVIKA